MAAIRAINALASRDSSALLVPQNFHRFLNSAEIVQSLVHQISSGKQNRTFIVILAPVIQIPTELEKLMVVVEQPKVFRDSAVGNPTEFFDRFRDLNVRSNEELDRVIKTFREVGSKEARMVD